MSSLLLSRIAKDFLNQDPSLITPRSLYRMGWSGSTLVSHPRATTKPKERYSRTAPFAALLLALGEPINSFIEQEMSVPLIPSSPQLPPPRESPPSRYQPARYFSKGALEADSRHNPTPIPYLLTEAQEVAIARPVPGNSIVLRSLSKGKGVLKQNKQGLIYLDIDNRFISSLIPYLKTFGLVRPPYFNLFTPPDGAHVPVIPAREMAFHYLDQIDELEREFSFQIEGLYSVQPSSWPEVEEVWFFKLSSPDLERLRRRYFLPATPAGHSFHIAIAVKPRPAVNPQLQPFPLMRINIAFLAA